MRVDITSCESPVKKFVRPYMNSNNVRPLVTRRESLSSDRTKHQGQKELENCSLPTIYIDIYVYNGSLKMVFNFFIQILFPAFLMAMQKGINSV